MCSTKWCFGDCDECIADQKYEEEFLENNKECPERKECNWVAVGTKLDKCTTCGDTYTYS